MAGLFGLIGAEAGFAGSKPVVPPAPSVNLQQSQATATAGNLANLPASEQVASSVDLFNEQEMQKMMGMTLPDYGAIQKQASSNIMSMLRGELPGDVVGQIQRAGAARGVASGTTGSEFASAATARDIGANSLALTEQGLSTAQKWIAQASAMTPRYDPTRMFVSPAQQLQVDQFNAENQFNVQWMKNRISAMPSAADQEIMGIFDWMDQTGKVAAGAYTGNVMGAGGQGQPSTMSMFGGGGGDNSMSDPNFNQSDAQMMEFYGLGGG